MDFYFSIFLSFITTIILVPIFGKISYKYKIIKRDLSALHNSSEKFLSDRKLSRWNSEKQKHDKDIERENKKELVAKPFLGGLVIFLSVIISTPFDITTRTAFIFFVFLGLFHDVNGVNRWITLLIQLISLSLIIYKYQGVTPYFPIFLFVSFVLIHSVTLFNKIDGLCLAILIPALIGLSFIVSSKYDRFLILSSLGAMLGFLIYNFPPARMYLGTSGEYFLSSILTVGFLSSLRHWNSNKSFVISSFIFLLPLLFEGSFSFLRSFSDFVSLSNSSKRKNKNLLSAEKCLCFKAINLFKDERKTFYFFLGFGLLSFTSGYLAKSNTYIGIIVLIILILIYAYMYITLKKE